MRTMCTREREKAERCASKALHRAGFDPDAIDPLYGEIIWKNEVSHVASWLLLQFDDLLPRERTSPITARELRDREAIRKWRCDHPRCRVDEAWSSVIVSLRSPAVPGAIDVSADDIPF